LNWRLKKHQQWHSSQSVKKCHYFNNNKECPYEKLGCMFDHALAGICQFGRRCSNELCSFQHEHIENVNDDDTTIHAPSQTATENDDYTSQNKDNSDSEQKSDFDQEECDTCDRIFKNNEDLIEHQTNDNCGFECKACGEFFRYETDLKPHQQTNCT
jgi:hypothetical protein